MSPGSRCAVVDLGRTLELTNDTKQDVVVLGYDDEPYLRVGPRGVFENTRSPATYINRSATAAGVAPKSADPTAPPRWKQVSTGQTAQWHDHRAHFMGTDDPPIVQRNRDHRFVFDHWTVTMLHDGETITASGEHRVGAAAVAVAVRDRARSCSPSGCSSRAGRSWWKQLMAGALVVIVVTEAVHVLGLWDASTESAGTKLVQSAYSLGRHRARGARARSGWRGAARTRPCRWCSSPSIVLVVAGGLSDVTTLGHSLIPTTLP